MELASYLAGERWSDHPACTHSLLASVARLVNDHTSDEGRPRLDELIPSVIGLTGDDLHIDAFDHPPLREDRAAGRSSGSTAGPCGLGAGLREGVGTAGWAPGDSVSPDSERVLGAVPQATQWADHFTSNLSPRLAAFRRQAAPHAVRFAVDGAAHALISDPDVMLRRMLVESIGICAAWTGKRASGVGVTDAAWAEACRLTVEPRTVSDG